MTTHSFEMVIPDRQELVGEGPCGWDISMLWFTDGASQSGSFEDSLCLHLCVEVGLYLSVMF